MAGVTNAIEVRGADFRWSRAAGENKKGAGPQPNCFLRLFCGVQKKGDEDRWWEDIDVGQEDYKGDLPPSLANVDMAIPPGSLVCIIGRVGTGKSTLLNGLINEAPCVRGSVTVAGTIAYCSQLPWIQNMTVRDNICCGHAFDEDKYEHAVSVCDMSDDMSAFADGDQTEIGERGINLSGGQKQRVSLCRAVYSDADVFILDDVLSAVDTHVGHHLMHRCILGALKKKTRVMVLHQLQYIQHADFIGVIEDGSMTKFGTYEQLRAQGVDFEQFVATKQEVEEGEGNEVANDDKTHKAGTPQPGLATPKACHGAQNSNSSGDDKDKGKLTADEDRETGVVRSVVFFEYIKHVGALTSTMIIVGVCVHQCFRISISWWLAKWSTDTVDGTAMDSDLPFYLGTYVCLCFGQVSAVAMRHGVRAVGQVRAARRLHRLAIWAVFRSSMAWFDQTITGKIVNRLSSDMQKIDIDLLNACLFMAFVTSSLCASIGVIIVNAPFVLVSSCLAHSPSPSPTPPVLPR